MSEPGDLTLRPTTMYGKPTGNVEVVTADGRVVMVFRKRRGERADALRKRAQEWVDAGARGIPGAPPRGRTLR